MSLEAKQHTYRDFELKLICLRVPFVKMVALPSGKQRSIRGPADNVPSKVDTICSVLPRLPSQTELVPLKLKRKVAYRGHYLYDYITPQKPLDALKLQIIHCMLILMNSGLRRLWLMMKSFPSVWLNK